jgi:CDP-glycerol glycerophosphotransferase (TagB/SpsB family)
MIHESDVLRKAQVVIRLHPDSHLEYFWKYWNRPGIKISFASVMPAIEWCPMHQDLIEQTNLLRHSDVIITPGSSWVLEAAIFDRPTVVPVYSDLQPEHAAALFDRWALTKHFRRLVDNKYVQITRSFTETKMAIEETFVNPKRYAEGRKAIVDQYVYYSDSQSGQRVAEWIANVAKSVTPGRPRGY